MAKKPPARGKRFLKLAGMTASVAGGYAKSRLKTLFQDDEDREATLRQSYERTGGVIADTLGELKGAAMKLGQMASMASDILPKELALPLSRLQKQAPPMDYEVIAEVIESELGATPEVLFAHIDREPFASASIGQVHRARTDDGREVVCKVQYPGIEDAVDSDLRQLRLALKAGGLARFGRRAMHEAFEDLRQSLHEELDYCLEADSVRAFADYHKDRHPFIAIPEVVGERSSQRVLTLTLVEGEPLTAVKHWPKAERDRVGSHLLIWIAAQLLELGAFHADPHPGNFAFRRDGTIIVYDYGSVKRLDPEIQRAYRDTIIYGLEEDYDAVDDALIRLGVRSRNTPKLDREFYKPWRDTFAEPFIQNPVFEFKTSTIHDEFIRLIPSGIKKMGHFRAAKDLIFIDRMIAGHYVNLRAMEVSAPVMEIARRYLEAGDDAAGMARSRATPS